MGQDLVCAQWVEAGISLRLSFSISWSRSGLAETQDSKSLTSLRIGHASAAGDRDTTKSGVEESSVPELPS